MAWISVPDDYWGLLLLLITSFSPSTVAQSFFIMTPPKHELREKPLRGGGEESEGGRDGALFPALATRAYEVPHTHRMAVKRMNLILRPVVQYHIIAVVS